MIIYLNVDDHVKNISSQCFINLRLKITVTAENHAHVLQILPVAHAHDPLYEHFWASNYTHNPKIYQNLNLEFELS